MKIYNGIRYLAIGSRSQFTGSNKRGLIEIEKTWYPFTGWWSTGFLFPVMIKSFVPRSRITDEMHTFNPEVIEFVKKYVDIKLEYFDDYGRNVVMTKDMDPYETEIVNEYEYHKVEDVLDEDGPKYNTKIGDISDKMVEEDDLLRGIDIDEDANRTIIGTRVNRLYTAILSCYSKQDGSYMGGVDDAYKKIRLGMIEFYKGAGDSACIGKTLKGSYFGFNHRGIHEFNKGDKVVKGDIAYHPNNLIDYADDLKRFWEHKSAKVYSNKIVIITKDNKEERIPCPDIFELEKEKGEWQALTEDDVKKMALDFSRGLN